MSGQDKDKKRLLKYRLILMLPYLITATILTPLVLIEKGGILVRIELVVRNVSLIFLGERETLLSSLLVEKAHFTQFEQFIIPFNELEIAKGFNSDDLTALTWRKAGTNGKLTLTPRASYSKVSFDNIRLNGLNFKKHARVTLSVPKDEEDTVTIAVDKQTTTGKIVSADTLRIQTQYCQFEGTDEQVENNLNSIRILNKTSRLIEFRSNKQHLIINLEIPENTRLFERNLDIEEISFLERNAAEVLSSVFKPGKITFQDLPDKEINIEAYDFVKIGKSEHLEITELEFQDGGIRLVLSGKIDELKTGTQKALASQLPSVLEWIYKKQPLILYMNTLLLVASTIATILQRLKLAHKEEGGKSS